MERITQQKTVVLETLGRMGHATAAQLYEEARRSCPGLGVATVYRLLAKRVAEGRMRRISFVGEDDRYDLTMAPHAHICCRQCGRVFDLPLPDLLPLEEETKARGFCAELGTVSLCGICADCRAECHPE